MGIISSIRSTATREQAKQYLLWLKERLLLIFSLAAIVVIVRLIVPIYSTQRISFAAAIVLFLVASGSMVILVRVSMAILVRGSVAISRLSRYIIRDIRTRELTIKEQLLVIKRERFGLRWLKEYSLTILILALMVSAVLLVIQKGYVEYIEYSNFDDKGWWDWLDLVIVPIIVAVAGLFIRATIQRSEQARAEKQAETERAIASEQQQHQTLQNYLDQMAKLLLENELCSLPSDEAKAVARARTVTTLPELDGKRKGMLLRFLYESDLISQPAMKLEEADLIRSQPAVNLEEADLSDAELNEAVLEKANLDKVILNKAKLEDANLIQTQ